jgi:hypothetical protein
MPIDNSYISPGVGRIFYSHRKPYQTQKIDVSPESLNLLNYFESNKNYMPEYQIEILDNWISDNIRNKFKFYNEFYSLDIDPELKEKYSRLEQTDRKRFLFMLAKYFKLL